MHFALLAVALAAAPVKVGVPGISAVGVDQAVADVWAERFITLLGKTGALKMTTQRDIAQVLGLERQKELLGCSNTGTSCVAELAGALGVEAVMSVTIAKSGSSFTATIRVVRATDGIEVASASERLKSEDAVQDWLEAQAPAVAHAVAKSFGREDVTPEKPGGGVARWIPAGVGLVLAAGGGVAYGASRSNLAALQADPPTFKTRDELLAAASSGRTLELAGLVAGAAGGVLLVGGVIWALLPHGAPVTATLAPLPGGVAAVVGGTF